MYESIPSKIVYDHRLDYWCVCVCVCGPHFSNLRSDKVSMLVKYDKTYIDSSRFVNHTKVHFLVVTTLSDSMCSTWIQIVGLMQHIEPDGSQPVEEVYSMASPLWMLYVHAPYRSRPLPPICKCCTCIINHQPLSLPLKLWRRARQYSLTSHLFPIGILQSSLHIYPKTFKHGYIFILPKKLKRVWKFRLLGFKLFTLWSS